VSTTFRTTTEADYEQLKILLERAFGVGKQSPLLDRNHMQWKYWSPRPNWSGSRSYVLEKDGGLLAHGCLWPFTLVSRDSRLSGAHLIDWAGEAKASGSGASIARKLTRVVDCMVSVGGAEATRRLLPMLGFRPAGEMWSFVRPLRPFRQTLTHQYKNWKLPMRLARNMLWSLGPKYRARGWTTHQISPGELPLHLLERGLGAEFEAQRSKEFYEYVLQCPIARYSLHLVSRDGEASGYFLLSFVPGQARIAELWMAEADVDSWAAAFTSAVEAGYRFYTRAPINCFASGEASCPKIELAMIDGDVSFHHHGHISYAS